jgi:hypothetical protein
MISKLMTRPQVVFDPKNKDHRKWATEFLHTKSWKNCPVRFLVNDTSLDYVAVMQRQLITYYADKEFNFTF